MNEQAFNTERLLGHQHLIAMMQATKPPAPDADTPAIPDEVLRRLREQYGRAPVRTVSLWTRVRQQMHSPQLALAACLLVLGVVVTVMLPHDQYNDDIMRGETSSSCTAPAYWLNNDNTIAAPTGLGLPKFISITSLGDLPKTGSVLVFDPAKREVRLVRDGVPTAKSSIIDAQDKGEWLTAHRQIKKLLYL